MTTTILANTNPTRVLIILFFALTCKGQTVGTQVAVAYARNEVVIAADSRAVNNETRTVIDNFCKIRRSGSVFYAMAGIIQNKATHFDAPSIVAGILKQPGTFQEKIHKIEMSLNNLLLLELKKVYASNPLMFKPETGMSLVVFTFTNSGLVLTARHFRSANQIGEPTAVNPDTVVDCSGADCGEQHYAVAFVGKNDSESIRQL